MPYAPPHYFQFNLTMSSLRPSRSTMINVVEDQLDRAAGNLENARRLAGRTARIPTWDTLMLAWSWYVNRDDDRRDSSTQTDRERGGAVHMGGSSWSAEAAERWANSLTGDELLDHPVVRVALERAVVERRPPSKGSRPLSWAPRPLLQHGGDFRDTSAQGSSSPSPSLSSVVTGCEKDAAGCEKAVAECEKTDHGPTVMKTVMKLVMKPSVGATLPPAVKGRSTVCRQKLPKVVLPTRWLVKKVCQMYDDQPVGDDDSEPEPVNWDVEKDGDTTTLLLRKSRPKNKAKAEPAGCR